MEAKCPNRRGEGRLTPGSRETQRCASGPGLRQEESERPFVIAPKPLRCNGSVRQLAGRAWAETLALLYPSGATSAARAYARQRFARLARSVLKGKARRKAKQLLNLPNEGVSYRHDHSRAQSPPPHSSPHARMGNGKPSPPCFNVGRLNQRCEWE